MNEDHNLSVMVEAVCWELPEGYQVVLRMESGAAYVEGEFPLCGDSEDTQVVSFESTGNIVKDLQKTLIEAIEDCKENDN